MGGGLALKIGFDSSMNTHGSCASASVGAFFIGYHSSNSINGTFVLAGLVQSYLMLQRTDG